MRKPPCLPLMLLALLTLAAGCSSVKTGRAKSRSQENPGGYADTAARSAYIDRRVDELTAKGLSKDAAAARASTEWFSSAPVTTESPTAYEKARRAEEAKIVTYLEKQKDADPR